VQFERPDVWREVLRRTMQNGELVAFQIPTPTDEGAPDAANASVATHVQDDLTLDAFVQYCLATITSTPGGALLAHVDGPNAAADRFVLLRAQQGTTRYVVGTRFAKRGSLFVYVQASWPLLNKTTKDWQRALIDMNALFSDLRIDGEPIGKVGGFVIPGRDA
jgi:hypothetical protein